MNRSTLQKAEPIQSEEGCSVPSFSKVWSRVGLKNCAFAENFFLEEEQSDAPSHGL